MFKRTVVALALACGVSSASADPVTLSLFGAGTLAHPFKEVQEAFEAANPDVKLRAQFGGSVMMARKIVDLHEPADILAVADYSVIPKFLMPANGTASANWYIGFAENAITFVYTPASAYAKEIDAGNWLDVLSRPKVQIGRSNPDTDPSGYQTLQMLALAETHYNRPGAAEKVLANAPLANMRDTETNLIAALQSGQIDYLAIYRSDALQHKLTFLALPREIDLSDPALAAEYAKASVTTKNGELTAKPIIYALTIPLGADHPAEAARFIAFLLGPEGRAIMARNGFGAPDKPIAVGADKLPDALRALAVPWPGR